MKIQGKISIWFILIAISMSFLLLVLCGLLIYSKEWSGFIICLVTLLFMEILMLPILFSNYVSFKNEYLLIVFGFIRLKIKYNDIKSVEKTNNPLSSLAASLDRIKIKYKVRSEVMIVVVDKELVIK